MRQDKQLDFRGQTVYAGLDAHIKDWKVKILLDGLVCKSFTQPPDPEVLNNYLRRKYPGARYKSVYEAGFCGFWIHEQLTALGIENIVVNPSDVPTTDKEKKQKTDKRDAHKLAKGLRSGMLEAIHVPDRELLEQRSLVRHRARQVKDMTRIKNRIKGYLHVYFKCSFCKGKRP